MSNAARLIQCLLVAGALAATASDAPAAGSPARKLFQPYTTVQAKTGSLARAPGVASDPVAVKINSADMAGLRSGEEVELALPGKASRTVVFELSQSHADGIRSYVGYLKDQGRNNRVILTTGPAGTYGVIDAPEGSYRIVPGKGHDWLVDMSKEGLLLPDVAAENDGLIPPASAKRLVPSTGKAGFTAAIPGVNRVGSLAKTAPAPMANIDVLIVVTQGLADNLGAGLMTRLNFLVTRANTAYADSEVAINLRLAGVTVVNYPDASNGVAALNAITPVSASFDSGVFGNVEAVRTQVKADIVAFLRSGSAFGGSGISWVGALNPDPNYMYSVITGCVGGCESIFIHEIGHNMGAMHDRATVAWEDGGTTNYRQGAEPWSYGYSFCKSGALDCDPSLPNGSAGACGVTTAGGNQPDCSTFDNSNFASIMSYFYNSARTLYKFSNPSVSCATADGDGVPRPCGISSSATGNTLFNGSSDTAMTLNDTRMAISAIKTEDAAQAGILHFTSNVYNGTEAGGSIVFTVSRSNGSGGAVSVNYATSSGTATEGTDYTGNFGVLVWGAGETADKTIAVHIINDGVVEGNETFLLTLSQPTGGASLAPPAVATGVILESWPPGGTAPPGFSSTVTPNFPWATATDSWDPAGSDQTSFKSGSFDANTAYIGTSATQVASDFVAGMVSFAYRVNSYPDAGFFEFLIDNTLIHQDSGESGWVTFAYPITAGAHVLEWRFRKAISTLCSAATPAPPQGLACADRAWIDSVTLPLVPPGPVPLSVSKMGNGSGTVTSSPAGINCGATCSMNVNGNTAVTLTPAPSAGSVFTGWSGGACAGTGPCYLTVAGATGVTANFDTPSATLPRLVNISTRMQVLTGNDVLIGGFVIGGSATKTVVIRARGPSLVSQGVTGVLANPMLQLFAGQTQVASNDNWQTDPHAAALSSSGYAPADPNEAAIYTTLVPGAYTVIVTGVGGTTGVALVEIFELDHPESPLVNISTRGEVFGGGDAMIGGFVIQGNSPQTVVVRGRGPSLASFGIANPLANPVLQLYSGPNVIASNDDWQSAGNASSVQASGYAPPDALESAILITLAPGAYTAILSGAGGGTGVGIIEVFAQ